MKGKIVLIGMLVALIGVVIWLNVKKSLEVKPGKYDYPMPTYQAFDHDYRADCEKIFKKLYDSPRCTFSDRLIREGGERRCLIVCN